MAKDKYIVSSMINLVGNLDYNEQDSLVVYVEKGKGDDVTIIEVPLVDVLENCIGRRIEIKIVDEKDKCDE